MAGVLYALLQLYSGLPNASHMLLHTLPSPTFSSVGQPQFKSIVQLVDTHIPDQPLPFIIIDRLQPSMRLTSQKSCPLVPRVNSASVVSRVASTPLHLMVPDPQSPGTQEPNPDPSKLHHVCPHNLLDQHDLKTRQRFEYYEPDKISLFLSLLFFSYFPQYFFKKNSWKNIITFSLLFSFIFFFHRIFHIIQTKENHFPHDFFSFPQHFPEPNIVEKKLAMYN